MACLVKDHAIYLKLSSFLVPLAATPSIAKMKLPLLTLVALFINTTMAYTWYFCTDHYRPCGNVGTKPRYPTYVCGDKLNYSYYSHWKMWRISGNTVNQKHFDKFASCCNKSNRKACYLEDK